MANSYFQFKQFRVEQSRSAMKVGTDGVLLGAWCLPAHGRFGDTEIAFAVLASQSLLRGCRVGSRVLDIGTGTGLIALMVAQRFADACIDALEIDAESYADAVENFARSPWLERLTAVRGALQDFAPRHKYDHIVSNPPFFNNSLVSPNAARTTARHTDSLTYDDLAEGVARLLSDDGAFSVVLPVGESDMFTAKAAANGLFATRKTLVYPKPDTDPKRVLMEFSKRAADFSPQKLIIETDARHSYTEEYVALTREFYLKF